MDVNFMDLDLNQEPTEPPPMPPHRVERHGSWLSELATANGTIEERIRQLQAVSVRTRLRQSWRQERNYLEIRDVPNHPSELIMGTGEGGLENDGNSAGIVTRTAERGIGYKRDNSHLVAKALEMDSSIKQVEKEAGSFYECNICLDVAKEPILTCCGHLFCWPCFYQVKNIDSTTKDCPVCKGEVSDSTVIPIYGNGDSDPVRETETGLKIPPRPKACRVESVRQQRAAQGLSHVPVAEALRRIRISMGAAGIQAQQQQEGVDGILNFDVSHEGQNADLGAGPRSRIHQVSRVLSESVASLTSLSSALSNAERLVEDLESVINHRYLRNGTRALTVDNTNSVLLPNNNPLTESNADINAVLPIAPSSLSADDSVSALNLLRARISSGLTLPAVNPYGRRTTMSRISGSNNLDPRGNRRRRLN